MPTQGHVGFNMTMTAGGLTVGKARDVTPELSSSEVDVTTRDSAGWKLFKQGLKEWGASVNQLWVPTDAALKAIESAFFNGTELAITFRDPDGWGYDGTAIVTGLAKGEPLDDAASFDATIKGTGALTVVTGTS